jgi:ABC-type glycerol-3-phosphate transport system substrate-binding protein
MVQALELYLSWHQGEQIIAPITSRAEAKALFTSGQAAMMIDGDWAIDELTQSEDIPWGVAVLPSISDAEQAPGPLVLGRYWTIGTDTSGPRAQAAIAFLEFVSQPERQLTWTEKFGTLPTRRDALVNSRLVADPALRVSAQQLQMGRGVPLNTDLNQILDAMRIPLEQTLAGTLSPSEAASQMQANLR